MIRKVAPSDVRTGAVFSQLHGSVRVIKVSTDRQRVTIAHVRTTDLDLGARFAGKNAYIYTWDGEGFWRGRGRDGKKHYLTIDDSKEAES